VLDAFPEIPVCVGYRYKGAPIQGFPADLDLLEKAQPVYEVRKGWQSPTEGLREYRELPVLAQDYLKFLGDQVGSEISIISTGADREETILRRELPGLELMLGRQ